MDTATNMKIYKPFPDMNAEVSAKFGHLMMALCEADAVIKAKDEEISNLKAALSAMVPSEEEEKADLEPHQEMLASR